MKQKLAFILTIITFISCQNNNEPIKVIVKTDTVYVKDTTPRVTGIGGIFFMSDNPKQTNEWYHKNLGIVSTDYGSIFEFRNTNRPEEKNYLIWTLFKRNSTYFEPSKKEFMINYRVQNIEGLIRNLKANHVTIVDSITNYEYGKFVHIMDCDGNKIELWEPVDSVLTKMDEKTNK